MKDKPTKLKDLSKGDYVVCEYRNGSKFLGIVSVAPGTNRVFVSWTIRSADYPDVVYNIRSGYEQGAARTIGGKTKIRIPLEGEVTELLNREEAIRIRRVIFRGDNYMATKNVPLENLKKAAELLGITI